VASETKTEKPAPLPAAAGEVEFARGAPKSTAMSDEITERLALPPAAAKEAKGGKAVPGTAATSEGKPASSGFDAGAAKVESKPAALGWKWWQVALVTLAAVLILGGVSVMTATTLLRSDSGATTDPATGEARSSSPSRTP
jgi:hypothetical protein